MSHSAILRPWSTSISPTAKPPTTRRETWYVPYLRNRRRGPTYTTVFTLFLPSGFRRSGLEQTLWGFHVPNFKTREASQSRVFHPAVSQRRRDARRPVESGAESPLHRRARRRRCALLRASLRLRRSTAPNGLERNRLHPPGARGR